jgi:hypothetical protein
MAGGRPTSYEAEEIAKGVTAYIESAHSDNFLPTVEGLAVHLSVERSTLYLWADDHPEFSDILEQLLAAQGSQLIQNGLVGTYNPTITKLMLSKHGYKDRSEHQRGNDRQVVETRQKLTANQSR